MCFRSLLSNLRKLTLTSVFFFLPTLKPVATRLLQLTLDFSRLQGSASGFLTQGWTALTSLSLTHTRLENATLTDALKLPALEDASIYCFRGQQNEELRLDQLTGSCLQVSRLVFNLSMAQATETSRHSCRPLNLSRLADLHIMEIEGQANIDLDLPPSLIQLRFRGKFRDKCVDFFWALREAAKCAGRGAHLRKLICERAEANLQPAQWGASLDEQHRRLGGQLGSLRELEVWGGQEQLHSVVGAVASAAPSLARLVIIITDALPRVEVSPICSASLESLRVKWDLFDPPRLQPPQVLLTFLPGCTRLQEVVVRFPDTPVEGAAVKIRCHNCSQECIMPVDVWNTAICSDVLVRFLQMPPPEEGGQDCTVESTRHAAGPEQPLFWGHAVMPGIL